MNNEERIIFPEDIDKILDEILQKYKLDETDEEIFDKLTNDQYFSGEIVINLTKKIINKEINEDSLSPLFQKEMNISEDIANNLAIDIKEKIIPFAQKILLPVEEEKEPEFENKEIAASDFDIAPNIKPPISVAEILEKPASPPKIEGEIPSAPKTKLQPRTKNPKPNLPQTEKPVTQPKKPKRTGPDSYREPIE